ncbi:vacuolar protein-sorting-associated protein 25 [Penaeus vannamei]|uniref:Vacuolar protein-sorting-associated protein 25 n=1 Tax=Penaeus vannamei TaxID=6689 RepID=A0A3R7P7Y1_PENVA|nr:vacuolar protein-sorting-associated protein 25-like [Penaeus vannamei]ROT78019.1 putative vacuolar protein-sorting-associated protein 25-like [Penaeus vannamei]
MTDFEWPWQYNFPPFFTLQPNSDVRKIQLDAWCALVLSWGKSNNVSQIDVTEASSLPVFRNSAISRALPADAIAVVLEELAKRGNLEWTDKSKRRGYLFWRSPTEWGQQIYTWAQSTSRINTVSTLYEINQGDETASEEFHGLDIDVLMKALKALEASGKVEIMDFGDNQGVKFL